MSQKKKASSTASSTAPSKPAQTLSFCTPSNIGELKDVPQSFWLPVVSKNNEEEVILLDDDDDEIEIITENANSFVAFTTNESAENSQRHGVIAQNAQRWLSLSSCQDGSTTLSYLKLAMTAIAREDTEVRALRHRHAAHALSPPIVTRGPVYSMCESESISTVICSTSPASPLADDSTCDGRKTEFRDDPTNTQLEALIPCPPLPSISCSDLIAYSTCAFNSAVTVKESEPTSSSLVDIADESSNDSSSDDDDEVLVAGDDGTEGDADFESLPVPSSDRCHLLFLMRSVLLRQQQQQRGTVSSSNTVLTGSEPECGFIEHGDARLQPQSTQQRLLSVSEEALSLTFLSLSPAASGLLARLSGRKGPW